MKEQPNTSVIILSAGFSSRMKQEKFSLMFDKHKTFLDKIIKEYQLFGCKEIVVVMNYKNISLINKNNFSPYGNVRFIVNMFPERERFYSLQCGMNALRETNYIFVQNVDNPFVTNEIIVSLFENKDKADYIIPSFKGKGGHPILISKHIAKTIKKEKEFYVNLKYFLKKFTKEKIEQKDDLILQNINTINLYNEFFNPYKFV